MRNRKHTSHTTHSNISGGKYQRGVTLIELMIAIAIGLAIAAMAVALAASVRKDQKAGELQQQTMQMVSQIQALANGNYTGINTQIMAESGKIPEAWITGAAGARVINHALGGTFVVADTALAGVNGSLLVMTALPRSACTSLLGNSQDVFSAIGSGTEASDKAIGGAALTAADIVAACTPTAPATTVTLHLTIA